MKQLNIYLAAIFIFALASCEDVVDVPLQVAEDLVVVDAWLTNEIETQTIRLSQTQVYFDSTDTPAIMDASVSVRRTDGEVFTFEHTGDGNYSWSPIIDQAIGDVGDVFELEILIGDRVYTSTAEMFRTPVIDSLIQEFIDDEVFLDDGIYTQFFSRDLPGLGDTYWIKTYKNGVYLNKPQEINLAYDAGFDSGGEVDGLIFIPPIRDLINEVGDIAQIPWEPGETLRVEIHSISNEAFAFMEIMRDQLLNGLNGIFAEPLANTRGNVVSDNGETVLGVFNVAAVSSADKIIE